MERIASKAEVRAVLAQARCKGATVAFVPTMGALHEGHLSLVRDARRRADIVCVSVFVNPTQFTDGDDFEYYPRDADGDADLLSAEGVNLMFAPSAAHMYAPGACVTVDPGPLAVRWEGEVRPGHFTGVATVVAKLLAIVSPDIALFGEKDYQQLQIVRRLVADLDLPVTVVSHPVVREGDGIAFSSRNPRFTPTERVAARVVPRALQNAVMTAARGVRDVREIERVMRETLLEEPLARVDYAAVVDPESLEPIARLDRASRVLIAVKIGAVRIVDSCALVPAGDPRAEGSAE